MSIPIGPSPGDDRWHSTVVDLVANENAFWAELTYVFAFAPGVVQSFRTTVRREVYGGPWPPRRGDPIRVRLDPSIRYDGGAGEEGGGP